jgi:hypothetical protein
MAYNNNAPWQRRGKESKTRVVNNVDKKSRDYLFLERIRAIEDKLAKARTDATRKKYTEELVAERHALWTCYSKLVAKMKYELIGTCNKYKYDMREEIAEYESRAYEKFEVAVDKVNMKLWYPLKAKALLFAPLWGRLSSMNRDLIADYIKNSKNTVRVRELAGKNEEKSSSVTNLDVHSAAHYVSVEDGSYKGIVKEVFAEAMKVLEAKMTKEQLDLWQAKKDGNTATSICKQFQERPKDLKAFVDSSAEKFKALVPMVSKRLGNWMSYEELAEELVQ